MSNSELATLKTVIGKEDFITSYPFMEHFRQANLHKYLIKGFFYNFCFILVRTQHEVCPLVFNCTI